MYDIVLENGLVADTLNKSLYFANVAIKDGLIAEISTKIMPAKRKLNVEGHIVSPGFIDVHSHIDGDYDASLLSCLQGITTYIGGNCGLSCENLADFFADLSLRGTMLNVGMLGGHSFTLRRQVGISDVNKRANASEISQMAVLAQKAMDDGAFGISLGLDYAMGTGLKEIDAMADILAKNNGIMPTHSRLFTQYDMFSLYELLNCAKRYKIRLLISHFIYQYCGYGAMPNALKIVDDAVASGLDVFIDSGMYSEWATFIGTATFDAQNLAANAIRLKDLLVATGMYTGQILDKQLYDKMRKEQPDESVICLCNNFGEVSSALIRDYAMPSTDAGVYRKGEGHPQIAGTFPKYFAKMVRENNILKLGDAIYKATLLPAKVFGIQNKGEIKEGFDADITVFNIDTIKDTANFPMKGKPDTPPIGIPYVIINGEICVDNGLITHKKAGKILKRPESL